MPINDYSKNHYSLVFENKYLKKKGQEFHTLFSDIMAKRYRSDFVRIRPWGNHGDQKNDGMLRSEGKIFAVYAPNDMKEAEFTSKVTADYEGAKAHWAGRFSMWVLVHNSYDGLGPKQQKTIDGFLEIEDDIEIQCWGVEELRRIVLDMEMPDLISLFGFAPSLNDLVNIEAESVLKIVKRLSQAEVPSDLVIKPIRGDKLKANRLSEDIKRNLRDSMIAASQIEWLFKNSIEKELGDRVARQFSNRYRELVQAGYEPNHIFFRLLDDTGAPFPNSKELGAAAYGLLAYLFEQCDIFEEPGGLAS
jgi:hypothetical protein